jgi:hypothetical protein
MNHARRSAASAFFNGLLGDLGTSMADLSWLLMNTRTVVENSIFIAWDYLDRAGELGNPEVACRVLSASIENLMRNGRCAR